jgi:hypothetical protein
MDQAALDRLDKSLTVLSRANDFSKQIRRSTTIAHVAALRSMRRSLLTGEAV